LPPEATPSITSDVAARSTTTAKAERWTLNRAGIVNVYQYGNETLDFGGGRLLLRGVNGSGKSTAMNMLLPFLLDGNTRRIDAAGEQSGVLRSWMLSGRDEAQPQGYLWIELAHGDSTLTFGCGIRANRSTERVTTWWFITEKRPGIDLHLVEGRVPLTADKLRAVIEPGVVYSHDQRAAYRDDLCRRLFGGADLDQHLHLLRIVRNPRVGDRLDADLPQYLEDALPQLSEAALDDAAKPLEDLEEHRRNVADLSRTAEALTAIQDVYRSYARTELHRIAADVLDAVRHHDRRKRAETRGVEAQRAALQQMDEAAATKEEHERQIVRLREEIRSLETSEAYKSGAQLNDLRSHVDSLDRAVESARDEAARRHQATEHARAAVAKAHRETDTEHDTLRERLGRLNDVAASCGLPARPPGIPSVPIGAESGDGPEVPSDGMDAAAADHQLGDLRGMARQRREDVHEVEDALGKVDVAERSLREAEQRAHQAGEAHFAATGDLDEARLSFQTHIARWEEAARAWLDALDGHDASHGLGNREAPTELGDSVSRVVLGESLTPPLRERIDVVLGRHNEAKARCDAALERHDETVTERQIRVDELAAKEVADPPAQVWQERGPRACLAELVDFDDALDAEERAGLEAAMEASGLLAAELYEDGTLRLADGQLVADGRGDEAPSPLSRLLRVDLADDARARTSATVVERVLRSISCDPGAEAFQSVVTTVGEFRLGALRGRHSKPRAEYIGVGARRAALERQRAEAALALEQAREARDHVAAQVEALEAAIAEARALIEAIPADREVINAFARREQAERHIERAAQRLAACRAEREAADQEHARSVDLAHRTATRLSLPRTRDALRQTHANLEAIASDSSEAQRDLVRLTRAVERWRARGIDWQLALSDQQRSERRFEALSGERVEKQARLAALESTIGVEYARVVAAIGAGQKDLEIAEASFEQSERRQLDASAEVAATRERLRTAIAEREEAHQHCVRKLPLMRGALTVAGLVEAALSAPEADASASVEAGAESASASASASVSAPFPTVDDHPDGARRLAEAVCNRVPDPGSSTTSADGVRQSLRRRRDTLGAGWDAEDHQPDPLLPLRIDVTGPLAPQVPLAEATAAVSEQLRTMTGLLSAKQDQALRNLLQGLVAREVAEKLHAAEELVEAMNRRLSTITTTHGIGVSLRWRRRDDLEDDLAPLVALLAKPPDLRTADEDTALSGALGERIDQARLGDPDLPYRELIAQVLDYRSWHRMQVLLRRPGQSAARLTRRTALSEGEKKIVSYLPLFAAVAASCDGLAERAPAAPRFVLLDDAFAKVSEDNHAKLFGLLVELDLDFIATSERLWGTHETVPELAITEVIRDAELGTIMLEHARWDGHRQELS